MANIRRTKNYSLSPIRFILTFMTFMTAAERMRI